MLIYQKKMDLADFIAANEGEVVKKRGRWGTYHFQLRRHKGDYQDIGSCEGDTVKQTLEKAFEMMEREQSEEVI